MDDKWILCEVLWHFYTSIHEEGSFLLRCSQDNIEEKQKREIEMSHRAIEVSCQSDELLAFEHKKMLSSIKMRISKKYVHHSLPT
jgi:hypothetical protein